MSATEMTMSPAMTAPLLRTRSRVSQRLTCRWREAKVARSEERCVDRREGRGLTSAMDIPALLSLCDRAQPFDEQRLPLLELGFRDGAGLQLPVEVRQLSHRRALIVELLLRPRGNLFEDAEEATKRQGHEAHKHLTHPPSAGPARRN